jgi:hypothetical protein
LKYIYVRPFIVEGNLKLELKFRYQEEELFEIHNIDEASENLKTYINNPFLSAILFTTEFDLTYKLNKKRAVSITESPNTFMNPSEVLSEYLNR